MHQLMTMVLGSELEHRLKTMKMNFTKKLSDTHKFEGLTLYRFSGKNTISLRETRKTSWKQYLPINIK
jgi:hypothetical protein